MQALAKVVSERHLRAKALSFLSVQRLIAVAETLLKSGVTFVTHKKDLIPISYPFALV